MNATVHQASTSLSGMNKLTLKIKAVQEKLLNLITHLRWKDDNV